jgi:hypothetical protein
VSAWSRLAERRAASLAVAFLSVVGSAARAQDHVAEVREALDRGRLDQALARTADISDASLREQWRFHVLYSGGDLSSALVTSLAATREHPADRELLGNAAIAATALGQGALADDLCRRWRAAIEAQTPEPEQRSALLRKVEQVAAQAREAAQVDAAAQGALGAARTAAIAMLSLCCAALVALARWRRPSGAL